MPIGATIGAAVIGGGAVIAGSSMSSHAQKQAAQTEAQTQAQSSADQLAMLKQLYQTNTANETPYLNAGYGALATQEQLLGLKPMTADQFNSGDWYKPGTVQYQQPTPTPATPGTTGTPATGTPGTTPPAGLTGNSLWDAYLARYPDVAAEAQRVTADHEFANPDAYAAWHYQHYGMNDGHTLPTGLGGATSPTPMPPATGFPAQPAGGPGVATTPQPAPGTQNPITLAQHAQQAIAAGADPQAISARLQQMGVNLL